MAGKRTLEIVITGDAKDGIRALDSVGKSTDTAGSKFAGFGKAAAAGFAIAGAAAVAGASMAINAASDLSETISKSNTIFGDAAAGIEKWASNAASSIGQSKQQALDAAATFGNMFTQLGIGSKQAAGMSTAMVELASDFASFHNADISEVLAAQTAAFRGEYDAVQRFVPTINAAAVEQKALAMTGKATTKELTLQEKALATQTLLMEGAGDAAGDFARTSDGLANKQRIMSAQFSDLTAKIGTALMPVMSALVDIVVTRVVPAFEAIGRWIADNQGVVIAFGSVIGVVLVAAFASWAASAAAAAAATLAAMAPVILITAAIAALAAGVVWAYQNFDWFRGIVDAVASFFTGTLWPALQTVAGFITGSLIPAVGGIISWFGNLIGKAREVASGVIGKFGEIVSFVASLPGKLRDAAGDLWGWVTGGLGGILTSIVRLFQNAVNAVIGVINGAIRAYNRLPLAPNVSEVKKVDWVGSIDPNAPVIASGKNKGKDPHHLAEGGIVRATPGGIFANIGEGRYDEAVIPLKPGLGLGGNTYYVTVNVEGSVLTNGQDLAQAFVDELRLLERQTGRKYLASV